MRFDLDDVIVASATAAGPGLRSIVRLSGADALRVAASVFKPSDPQGWPSKQAWRVDGAFDWEGAPFTPEGFALVWPTSASFTREPVVEFHTEVFPEFQERLIEACVRAGARPAQRGEFTLRAFLAGRIDLTRAEAVLGVIDARNDRELDAGLEQLAGGLAQPLGRLRDELLNVLADIEAGLDFVDEDIAFIDPASVKQTLERAIAQLRSIQQQVEQRSALSSHPVIALVGPPNAGKSSLFNSLLGREQALVSSSRGTTRDHLESRWECGDVECLLVDTAGLGALDREFEIAAQASLPAVTDQATVSDAIDAIDERAQQQSHERLATADLVLLCLPLEQFESLSDQAIERLVGLLQVPSERLMLVATKSDQQVGASRSGGQTDSSQRAMTWVATSSVERQGIEALVEQITACLAARVEASGGIEATSQRCAASLKGALGSLQEALATCREELGDELVSASIRLALADLGTVTGEVATEDLLDRVFGRFCIGK